MAVVCSANCTAPTSVFSAEVKLCTSPPPERLFSRLSSWAPMSMPETLLRSSPVPPVSCDAPSASCATPAFSWATPSV